MMIEGLLLPETLEDEEAGKALYIRPGDIGEGKEPASSLFFQRLAARDLFRLYLSFFSVVSHVDSSCCEGLRTVRGNSALNMVVRLLSWAWEQSQILQPF